MATLMFHDPKVDKVERLDGDTIVINLTDHQGSRLNLFLDKDFSQWDAIHQEVVKLRTQESDDHVRGLLAELEKRRAAAGEAPQKSEREEELEKVLSRVFRYASYVADHHSSTPDSKDIHHIKGVIEKSGVL
ncbi:hypothetical protein SEA_INCA_47 [Mycobacterium phage Inca]|uniref:Uncharacterized protein n=4 Tax=Kostyavirus toto TaxID=1993871 RepID=G1DHY5_9CAUD|nr:hypothetical protein SEA_TOTO_49 [Mycobacterium phage Toto]AGR48888.1 hypothetical protein PBI_ABCAT_48 [Mycobacterium phage ABCat]APU02869.1 hypothetical protein SEA_CRYSTALP_50 [Mycobacterium phage CrystalP]AXH47595.1 hypothetical protein SEA_IHOP_48 [Mycobacterium phage IHOP]AXH48227.1 hypothetical protein SEA_PHAJA_48 [Mycobacterium phage Phaja]AXH65721.1 hypothetical protein SEA_INCA_47 [Mycobacterium phage Inca]QGJ96212.1 hypothetical protein SEA_MYRALE_50 [Mycobacterium phage Myrale